MRWWWYLLYCPVLCGQSFLDEWTPARTTVLDTLTINNCPPELLWQWFGLTKEAVYAIVEYREYMGHIVDPIELIGLPGLTKQEILVLADVLPFSKDRPRKSKSQIIYSGSLRDVLRMKAKCLGNQGRMEWGWSKELSIDGKTHSHSKPTAFITSKQNGKVQSKWLIGRHTFRLGQGLVSGTNGFGSSLTREQFTSGLRGTLSSYGAIRNGFGATSRYKNTRLLISVDEANTCSGALEYCSPQGSIGLGQVNKVNTTYFKWQWQSQRWFGEFTSQEQALGWNWWRDDVLFEGYLHRKQERTNAAISLQWRDALGQWSLQLHEGRLKGNWKGSVLRYQCASSDEGTFRHRLTLPWEQRSIDVHYHNGTYGGSIRSSKTTKNWQLQSAVGWVKADSAPIWLAVPVATGFIGAQSIYDDFFGYHLKVNTGGWSASMSYDFTTPFRQGFTVQWRYTATLDELRPMVPKIGVAFFDYRRLAQRNWKVKR